MSKSGKERQLINSSWLVLVGILVLFLPVFWIFFKVIGYTNGIFIYPYDDTFIHLQMADSLLKGYWGVSGTEFASASSSILYTIILAAGRLVTSTSLLPFIVNCITGILILSSLHFWLRKHKVNIIAEAIIMLLVIFITPLPLLILSGMEHSLQCLFSFLFIFYFSDWLEGSIKTNSKLPLRVLLFAVLATTIRYEGLFLLVIPFLLLIAHRKYFESFLLGGIAVLPVLVFGFISVYNGNYFVPNSVLVKSQSFDQASHVQTLYEIFFEKFIIAENGMASLATQRLAIAIPLVYLLFRNVMSHSYRFILMSLFVTVLLQLAFASTGYLYRYESYLFFCFIIITALIFYKYGRGLLESLRPLVARLMTLALAFFIFFPVILRAASGMQKAFQASVNIYDQQFQMAGLISKYYDKSPVALNDIGAVSYFTNADVVDLWGLANIEVTKSKMNRYWAPEFIDSFSRSHGVEVAIIYDTWFAGSLPDSWHKVATWQIQNNVICGDDEVSFYTLQPNLKPLLYQNLKSYEKELPVSVKVKYY